MLKGIDYTDGKDVFIPDFITRAFEWFFEILSKPIEKKEGREKK